VSGAYLSADLGNAAILAAFVAAGLAAFALAAFFVHAVRRRGRTEIRRRLSRLDSMADPRSELWDRSPGPGESTEEKR
jgi:hypothetical protein